MQSPESAVVVPPSSPDDVKALTVEERQAREKVEKATLAKTKKAEAKRRALDRSEAVDAWLSGSELRTQLRDRALQIRFGRISGYSRADRTLSAHCWPTSPFISGAGRRVPDERHSRTPLPRSAAPGSGGGSSNLGGTPRSTTHRSSCARPSPSPFHERTSPSRACSSATTADRGQPVYVDYEHLTRHLFILGQSGVGKTVSASSLMYQQMQRGGGCLFINGKSDFGAREQFWQMARYCGREADVLWIVPDTPEASNTYSPVLHGDPDEKADGLLMLIPSTDTNPGADHFKQEAKQALTTLIAALQRAKLAYNMIDLTVLLMSSKALEELERRLKLREADSEEAKNFSLFLDKFRKLPSEKNPAGGIDVDRMKTTFGGIGGRLYTFGTGSFGQVMNTYEPDVVLHEAIRANKLVYVDLPTMGKDTTARNFGRLVIADLRSAIAKIQRLPHRDLPWPPYMVFADEAGSYVNDSWSRIPEQARSARIFFMPAAQTAANFQAISDELYEMVIGNAWTKLYFKIGTQATAEECADLIGMKVGVARSMTHSESASASMNVLRSAPESSIGDGFGRATLQRQEEQYIVSPDDLKRLRKGECVMTKGGEDIYHLKIPMLSFSPDALRRIGPSRVYRWRSEGIKVNGVNWEPAAFFTNVERYLTSAHITKEQRRADEEDERDMAVAKTRAGKGDGQRAPEESDEVVDHD